MPAVPCPSFLSRPNLASAPPLHDTPFLTFLITSCNGVDASAEFGVRRHSEAPTTKPSAPRGSLSFVRVGVHAELDARHESGTPTPPMVFGIMHFRATIGKVDVDAEVGRADKSATPTLPSFLCAAGEAVDAVAQVGPTTKSAAPTASLTLETVARPPPHNAARLVTAFPVLPPATGSWLLLVQITSCSSFLAPLLPPLRSAAPAEANKRRSPSPPRAGSLAVAARADVG